MKRNYFTVGGFLLAASLYSCNNGSNTSANNADSTTNSSSTTTTANSAHPDSSNVNNTPTNSTAATNMPLTKEDSTFVMNAGTGGMMEVELGKLAQENGKSERVKGFGQMMVTDHSKANEELKSYASSHGMSLPSSLPAKEQKHVDAMKKMKGKAFDDHYMSMMVNGHKEVISNFEKASKDAKDADLKNWAGKTLPTLKTHLDSAQAINKHKM
ncbi:MAG: hypothetical protein NVS1B13_11780 [Flavisolibacter sp.]